MEVGVVAIRVRPQLKGFRKQVERELAGMGDHDLPVGADGKQLKKDVRDALKDSDKKLRVSPELDTKRMSAQGRKLASDLQKSLGKKIDLTPTFKPEELQAQVRKSMRSTADDFESSLRDSARRLKKIYRDSGLKLDIDTKADLSGLRRDLRSGLDRLQREFHKFKINVDVDINTDEWANKQFHTDAFSQVAKKLDKDALKHRFKKNKLFFRDVFKDADGSSMGDFLDISDQVDRFEKDTDRASKAMVKFQKTSKRSKVKHSGHKILGIPRGGWLAIGISAIAAPAIEAIGGLAASLPAIGAAAGVALGAVVLGFDGIKNAAKQAQPQLDEVRKSVSDVFEQRLGSQFETLGNSLVSWSPKIQELAHGMADFGQGFVDAVSSARGFNQMNSILGNTARLFSDMRPFAHDFTDGLLQMAAVGSSTFPKLSDGMNRFGETFRNAVNEMSSSGALEQAIESTYEVLGSMGTNIGRMIRVGIEEFTPEVSAAFDNLFTGLADGVIDLMPVFSEASSSLATNLGDVFRDIGTVGEHLGPGLADGLNGVFEAINGITSAAAGLAPALAPITNLGGLALDGVGSALNELGDSIERISNADVSSLEKIANTDFSGMFNDVDWSMGTELGAMFDDIISGFERAQTALTGSKFQAQFSNMFADAGVQLDDFMGKMDRVAMLGLNMANHEMVIDVSLRKLEGADLSAQIQDMVSELEALSKVTKINLDPQIEIAKNATSADQLSQLGNQVADAFKNGTLGEPTKVEVPVEPDVKVEEGAMGADTAAPIVDKVKADMEASFDGLAPELQSSIGNKVSEALNNLDMSMDTAATGMSTAIGQKIAEEFSNVEIPMEGLKTNIGEKLNEAFSADSFDVAPSLANLGTSISEAMGNIEIPMEGFTTGLQTKMAEAFSGEMFDVTPAIEGLGTSISTALSSIEIPMEGFTTSLSTALSTALSSETLDVSTMVSSIGTSISTGLGSIEIDSSGISSKISSALQEASSAVGDVDFSQVGAKVGESLASGIESSAGTVQAAAQALSDSAKVEPQDNTSAGLQSGQTFATGMQASVAAIAATAATISAAAVIPPVNNYASGYAAGSSFAAGMMASVGAVRAAASALAAAAASYMPHSPAKEGPLSGRGYTTHSGHALAMDFANAIASHESDVGAATAKLAGAVHNEFEAANRYKAEKPVMLSNAKKIQRALESHDKRILEAQEKHAERTQEWAEKGSKGKAPEYKAPEFSLPELDEVKYDEIDRSVKEFYVGTLTDAFEEGMNDWVKSDFIHILKDLDRRVTSEFGDYPFSAEFRGMLDDPRLPSRLQKVLKDANVAELPVEIVFKGLDSLKQELGMGDGAIPRALKVAYEYDPAATDDIRERNQDAAPPMHFHVLNVDEAMRIAEVQAKREFMKKD